MEAPRLRLLLILSILGCASVTSSHGVESLNFNEAGTIVNGFQDDFDGTTLNSSYLEFDGTDPLMPNPAGDDPNPFFTLDGNGHLLVGAANGDPNKLLYNATYDASVQEILLRITVTGFGMSDGDRGGPSLVSSASTGAGINLQFRDGNGGGRRFVFLDDQVDRTDAFNFNFANGTPYWMRLRNDPGADGNAGAESFAKVWAADGVTPEPTDYQASYDYAPGNNQIALRTGLAGISAASGGAQSSFSVDYLLLKANGLPSITVVPEPASAGLLVLGLATFALRRRRA